MIAIREDAPLAARILDRIPDRTAHLPAEKREHVHTYAPTSQGAQVHLAGEGLQVLRKPLVHIASHRTAAVRLKPTVSGPVHALSIQASNCHGPKVLKDDRCRVIIGTSTGDDASTS